MLASDRASVDFVRILLFQDFTQVANRAALDKIDVPPPTPGAWTLPPPEPAPSPAKPPALSFTLSSARPVSGAAP